MAGKNKFGTFAGVFTPSILTILGVILYMRLGWVVGNAGLVGAIAIIIIAHIIAITTGLSVSSVATDKKIGAGGIYYTYCMGTCSGFGCTCSCSPPSCEAGYSSTLTPCNTFSNGYPNPAGGFVYLYACLCGRKCSM